MKEIIAPRSFAVGIIIHLYLEGKIDRDEAHNKLVVDCQYLDVMASDLLDKVDYEVMK
jgi:hypothetical protein